MSAQQLGKILKEIIVAECMGNFTRAENLRKMIGGN